MPSYDPDQKHKEYVFADTDPLQGSYATGEPRAHLHWRCGDKHKAGGHAHASWFLRCGLLV